MKPISSRALFRVNRLILLAAGVISSAGCSSTSSPKLAAIPAPPPILVEVPTFIALPADATTPCQKPQPRPIRTDLDLLKAADAFKVWGMCNQNKLEAIRGVQP